MATPERYNALLKNCNYLLNLLLLLSKIKIWCPQKIKFLLFEYFIELSLGLHCPEWPHPSCTPAPKPHPLNITIISTGSSHMLSFPHLHHQYLYNTLYVQAVVILLGLGTLKIKALFLWKWELHTWFANAPTLSGPQISQCYFYTITYSQLFLILSKTSQLQRQMPQFFYTFPQLNSVQSKNFGPSILEHGYNNSRLFILC